MEKDELRHDYKNKKSQHEKDTEQRNLEKEEKQWLIDRIKSLNLKKLRAFIEDDYKKYENTKLGVTAHKNILGRLAELIKEERMYCYDVLRDLFKSEKEHDLTEQEYFKILNGEEVKLDKDATNSFRVERKRYFKPPSGNSYSELLVLGKKGGNDILKKIYLKREEQAPEFDHKEHPQNYLKIFDVIEAENLRLETYENGGEM